MIQKIPIVIPKVERKVLTLLAFKASKAKAPLSKI
jgi:hypothetical protein